MKDNEEQLFGHLSDESFCEMFEGNNNNLTFLEELRMRGIGFLNLSEEKDLQYMELNRGKISILKTITNMLFYKV